MSERLAPIFIGNADQAEQVMELLHERHLNPVVLEHRVFDRLDYRGNPHEEHEVHIAVPIVEEGMARKILIEHERLAAERVAPIAKDTRNALIRISLAVILLMILGYHSSEAFTYGLCAMLIPSIGYVLWKTFRAKPEE